VAGMNPALLFDVAFTGLRWLGFSIFGAVLLWLHYLAVMNLKGARDRGQLTGVAKMVGIPLLASGYVLDFLVNLGPMSVLLFEPPREMTVTARLKRHKYREGWRGRVSRWFAEHLLDPFDPSGRHI